MPKNTKDRRRKHRKAATAVVATPVVCPNLLQLEEDRASLAASEFLTRFIALIAAELRPGLGPHFFQVYETTMQVRVWPLGSCRCLLLNCSCGAAFSVSVWPTCCRRRPL